MQILGTWDQRITHIKTWTSGVWSGQPLGLKSDPLALSVCFLAFGMWIHLIVTDSLSSSRGKGEDGFFSALFSFNRLAILANSYWAGGCRPECTKKAIVIFSFDLRLLTLLVPRVVFSYNHPFTNTGGLDRKPWALNMNYLWGLLQLPHQPVTFYSLQVTQE